MFNASKQNKAKAKGLLEVMVLISGDTTRRNVPGNAFRRAKARLLKKGIKAGLVSRGLDGSGQDGDRFDEDNLGGTPFHRLELPRALSRVTEEDCMSRDGSFMHNISGLSDRDLEAGASGGHDSFRNTSTLRDSLESGGGNSSLSWSSRRGGGGGGGSGRKKGSAKGVELGSRTSSGGERGAERNDSSPCHDRGATGGAGRRSGGAKEPSGATARGTDHSTSVREDGEGHHDGGSSGGDGQKKALSRTFAHTEGMKHLGCDSTDGSSRPPEDTTAGENGTGSGSNGDDTGSSLGEPKRGPSRGGGGTRSSIRLADTLSEAKLGRDDWPRKAGKKKEAGPVRDIKAKVTKSTLQSHFGRSRSPRIDVVNESSGEEKSESAAVATGAIATAAGKVLSRSHRRTAPKISSESTLPPLSSPAVRHRRGASGGPTARPGENVRANATAKKARHGSSRARAAARAKAQAALAGSPLDDVRTLALHANTAGVLTSGVSLARMTCLNGSEAAKLEIFLLQCSNEVFAVSRAKKLFGIVRDISADGYGASYQHGRVFYSGN